jgi:hypothetical protein
MVIARALGRWSHMAVRRLLTPPQAAARATDHDQPTLSAEGPTTSASAQRRTDELAATRRAEPPTYTSTVKSGPRVPAKVVAGAIVAAAILAIAIVVAVRSQSTSSGVATSLSATKESAVFTPAAPPPAAPSTTRTALERLKALGPLDGRYSCERTPRQQPASAALDQLSCFAPISPEPWIPNIVTLDLFADAEALDSALNQSLNQFSSKGGRPQPCPGFSAVPADWHPASAPQRTDGKIGCLWSPGELSSPYLYWTSNAQLVLGEVTDVSNLNKLYQWWLGAYGQ